MVVVLTTHKLWNMKTCFSRSQEMDCEKKLHGYLIHSMMTIYMFMDTLNHIYMVTMEIFPYIYIYIYMYMWWPWYNSAKILDSYQGIRNPLQQSVFQKNTASDPEGRFRKHRLVSWNEATPNLMVDTAQSIHNRFGVPFLWHLHIVYIYIYIYI